MDERLRNLERAYAGTGTLEDLDALDRALLQAGGSHPDADKLRRDALGTVVLMAGRRVLEVGAYEAGKNLGKSMLALSQLVYLGTRLDRLRRLMKAGVHLEPWEDHGDFLPWDVHTFNVAPEVLAMCGWTPQEVAVGELTLDPDTLEVVDSDFVTEDGVEITFTDYPDPGTRAAVAEWFNEVYREHSRDHE